VPDAARRGGERGARRPGTLCGRSVPTESWGQAPQRVRAGAGWHPVPGAATADGGGCLGPGGASCLPPAKTCPPGHPCSPTRPTRSAVRGLRPRPAVGTPSTQTGARATVPTGGRHTQGLRQRPPRHRTGSQVGGLPRRRARLAQGGCRCHPPREGTDVGPCGGGVSDGQGSTRRATPHAPCQARRVGRRTAVPGTGCCTPTAPNNALVAPREAQNLGIGSDPMKLVVVTQWVRASTAPIPPD
jgi:hypothetical protein